MSHHVIILGAGASVSSGLPTAPQLRLLLTAPKILNNWIFDFYSDLDLGQQEMMVKSYLKILGGIARESLNLFREGAFATVDEFSKLSIQGNHTTQVPNLKRAMRLALAIRNPDEQFHASDYLPFIQKLFLSPEEATLRKDLTILSFNYDTFFEYALTRAYATRRHLDKHRLDEPKQVVNALNSGFYEPQDRSWLACTLKVLKLHGAICFSNSKDAIHAALFHRPEIARHVVLCPLLANIGIPPVVFPWEIFDNQSNQLLGREEFCLNHPPSWREGDVYQLLVDVWKQAREAVQEADKVSFIGVSAHSYLMPGFQFLFEGKQNEFQCIVANPENAKEALLYESSNRDFFNPLSISGKISSMLNTFGCKLRRFGRYDLKPLNSFAEFIRTQI